VSSGVPEIAPELLPPVPGADIECRIEAIERALWVRNQLLDRLRLDVAHAISRVEMIAEALKELLDGRPGGAASRRS
jgi:hypothetical protein